jgi:hypothetical protein
MAPTEITRATSRMSASGSCFHVLLPKPILKLLPWKPGEELMVLVQPDATIRVVTLEQWVNERLEADRAERRNTPERVRA